MSAACTPLLYKGCFDPRIILIKCNLPQCVYYHFYFIIFQAHNGPKFLIREQHYIQHRKRTY